MVIILKLDFDFIIYTFRLKNSYFSQSLILNYLNEKINFVTTICTHINAQYCLFFDIKVDEPEMVVSAMNELMNTDWGKV